MILSFSPLRCDMSTVICDGCKKSVSHYTRVIYCRLCIGKVETFSCVSCENPVLRDTYCRVCPLCGDSTFLCHSVALPGEDEVHSDVCESCFDAYKSGGSILQCTVTGLWFLDDGHLTCGERHDGPCVQRT